MFYFSTNIVIHELDFLVKCVQMIKYNVSYVSILCTKILVSILRILSYYAKVFVKKE